MRRTLFVAVLSAVLLTAGIPSPAGWSASREVQDAETTTMTGDVEISSVTFTHGRRHISMRAEFASLPDYVEYYRFEIHGPHRHSWSLGWAHESAQWEDHKRVKWIYLFEPTFRHLHCKVAWHQDLEAGLVTARFPTRCLRIKGKAVPWLRMQFSAEDIYEDSHIQDWAPGGNSNNGEPGRFTSRIRRG